MGTRIFNQRSVGVGVATLFLFVAAVAPFHRLEGARVGDGAEPADPFTAWLEAELPGLMEADGVPGVAVLVVEGRERAWAAAFGMADRASGRRLTPGSVIMAHSISKSVTAWGVMKLVEEGRIALDDPVSRHIHGWALPDSDFPASGVTVRRLLGNSAGLPLGSFGAEYTPGDPTPPLTETLVDDEVRLERVPGTAFSYSNAGYGILELLVEEVTGRDFSEYMEGEVLEPLGMARSTFAWRDGFAQEVATGYDLDGEPVPPFLYPYRASGGLFTTLEELGRFVAAELRPSLEEGPVLTAEGLAALHRPMVEIDGMFGVVADAYGLGHFVETLPEGGTAIWHGGQGHGWMTHFHAVPATGDGIVIVTNSQRSWPLMARVLDAWSRDRGFGPVAFGRITTVVRGLWLVVGVLFLASALLLREAVARWRSVPDATPAPSTRSVPSAGAPPSRPRAALRVHGPASVQAVDVLSGLLGAVLLGGLGWASRQDYLFITSIFPSGSGWLALGVLVLGLSLLAFAASSRAEGGAGPATESGTTVPAATP